jgi:prevent-host-death family protein
MYQLTVSELQRNIGAAQDAADKEPVFITRNGREKYVLLSAEEYHRLKRRDREVLGVEELSEEDVRAIAVAEVPAEYAYLNDLLKKK